ncbi:nucleotidyltransferase domain-containing protein [Bacillus sp. AL-1R]
MIIKLLKSIYSQTPTLPIESISYEQLLEDIEFFSISGQIYYLLKKHNLLEQTPLFFQESLKKNYTKVLYQNIFIKNEWEKIASLFDKSGIITIPLKGVTFAEKYFENIGARPTSDIDILIKPNHINQAIELIKSLGFIINQDPITSHFHCSFSKILPNSPIPLTVEIHWNIMREDTSSIDIEDFWNNAQPLQNYNYIYELSEYHTFYMICLHGWRHNLDSLKYFLDIMQLIYILGEKVDYEKLFQDAASHETLKRMLRTLSIVYGLFPELHYLKPFNCCISTTNWDYHNIRHPNGKCIKKYIDFIEYQFFSYDRLKYSFVEFRNFLILK